MKGGPDTVDAILRGPIVDSPAIAKGGALCPLQPDEAGLVRRGSGHRGGEQVALLRAGPAGPRDEHHAVSSPAPGDEGDGVARGDGQTGDSDLL